MDSSSSWSEDVDMWSSAWEDHSVDVPQLDVNMNPESNTLFPDYLRSTLSASPIYRNRNLDPLPPGAFHVERNLEHLSTDVEMHTEFQKAAASVCTIQYFNFSHWLTFHLHRFQMYLWYGQMEIITTQHWIQTLSFSHRSLCSL